jgi:SAM-dependent methyltransferase
MHLNCELLFTRYALPVFCDNMKVLEIGPAGYPSTFQTLVNNPSIEWHTMDFASSEFVGNAAGKLTHVLESEYKFPISDEQYDLVVSANVVEHVRRVWTWFAEVRRVTKPRGKIVTLNPVSWPFHQCPYDCWRIYPDGIRALAEELELEVDLCLFESLEREELLAQYPDCKFIPGESYTYFKSKSALRAKLLWNRFVRRIPYLRSRLYYRVEVAFDTVSVLTKR